MEPPLTPKREWIRCGVCGLQAPLDQLARATRLLEHIQEHAPIPPDLLPGIPGARC